jgi:hypothetical protein
LDPPSAESQAAGALELDPFAFHPGIVSRIKGLGGGEPTHNPEYAFHTPYVETAEGQASFTVRFKGLTAKRGTLVLRVHMTPLEQGGRTRLVNSMRIALNRVIALGGEVSVGFEGFHDVVYALVGLVVGDTDAEAEDLVVTLDHPADPTKRREYAAEARGTVYGNTPLEPAPMLLSTARPTLTDPVTQIATGGQLRDPAAGGWMARLRPRGKNPLEHWRKVYTLQVLRRYGMLETGAVGVGFEPSPSGVPAAMAALQTRVTTVLPAHPGRPLVPEQVKADLAQRAPCDPVVFDRNVTVRVDSWRRLPDELVNFDFAWSAGATEQLYSVAAATQFVHDVMACLRPGGLAVHVLGYDLVPASRSVPTTERLVLHQGDVERIALLLVSRGHEVAQFKISAPEPILAQGGPAHGVSHRSLVGLITRKAPLPDAD